MVTLTPGINFQSGKYEIVDVLSAEGLGITYLVSHSISGTYYVIKEYFPSPYCKRVKNSSEVSAATLGYSEVFNRLRNQFIIAAGNISKIQYPGIIQILEVFEENNTAYYVMEYIKGLPLESVVKKHGSLLERDAIELIVKVGKAIDFMHQRKMTHFDVCPSNIVIREDNGEPVLIDFGLFKPYPLLKNPYPMMTVAINPFFCAPEHYLSLSNKEYSPQTDVYSLGATLYFLLTGVVPPETLKLIHETIELPETVNIQVTETIKWAMMSDLQKRCPNVQEFVTSLTNPSITHTQTKCAADSLQILNDSTCNETNHEDTTSPHFIPIHDTIIQESNSKVKKKALWLLLGILSIIILTLVLPIFISGSPSTSSFINQEIMGLLIEDYTGDSVSSNEILLNRESFPIDSVKSRNDIGNGNQF